MILKHLGTLTLIMLTLGACTGSSGTTQTEITEVSGTITYRERMALTADAEVDIKLLDVSLADASSVELASTVITNPGQVPISFKLEFNPAEIEERKTYVIRADIRDRGRRMFTTDTSYPVLTRGSNANVNLTLVAMNSNPASKPNASLTETYWRVISIYEEPYTPSENQREAHLKLRTNNNVVQGFSGCNNFAGTYSTEGDAISLGPLAMTAMACIDGMDTEQQFGQALNEMDHYEIQGDTMLGLKGDIVILQFEAIYF
jgi:putative lipoprotein